MSRKKLPEDYTPENSASRKRESRQDTAKEKNSDDRIDRTVQNAKGTEKGAREEAGQDTMKMMARDLAKDTKKAAAKETSKETTQKTAKAAKEAAKGTTKEMAKTSKGQAPVQSLRRYNVRMLIVSVAMLMVLCVLLLLKIRELNETIENMTIQVAKLTQLAVEQQEQLQELTAAMEDAGSQSGDGQGTGTAQGDQPQQSGEEGIEEITAAHKVYLTFDDGPSTNTQAILDILDQYGVKATFFVVGKETDSAKESMKKIVEAGHTLAMHSYTHKYSELYDSVESFAADFAKEQEYIYDVTGVVCTVYRFPGGSSNTVSKIDMKDCAKYLDTQGVRFFDWNISSGDGGSYLLPVETIVENCTKNISKYSTSVVLMHDAAGKSTTVEALPTIIETILDMEDTVILPITDETTPIQHIKWQDSDTDETE